MSIDRETERKVAKVENFVLENKKSLSVIGGAIAGLVLLLVWYLYVYIPSQEKEAQNQMFHAERYFADGSFSQAINGDGSYPGFKQMVEDYNNTKAGNLAQYYLGISYLRVGQYQDAITHLTSFSSADLLLSTIALGATGDAYSELKDYEKAIVFYKKATEKHKNDFTTAMYLKKLGLMYENIKDYKSAVETYQTIKTQYATSNDAKNIESYIARASTAAQSL